MIHHVVTMLDLALMHVFCFAAMTERKYSVRKTALAYALYIVFFIGWTMVVSATIGAQSPYTAPAMFFVLFGAAFLLFTLTSSDAFCKKLFLFVSYINMFCILYCMSAIACNTLFPALSETGTLYARNIMRTLLQLLVVWAYLKLLRPRIQAVPAKMKRTWYAITLVSLMFLAVFTYFIILLYPRTTHTGENIFLFIAAVLLYCSVLWVIFRMIRYMNDESKMELISKNAEYQQIQLALAEENELAAKAIRHDFRHHIQNIAALLQKDDAKEALRYIERYGESLEAAKPKEFYPNATVNAILSSFYHRAQKEGVAVSISADTPVESPIADMDYVAVLSNLLENALNGCRECGSKGEIRVDIRTVSDKTVIVCSNPCKPGLMIEDGMLRSRGTGIDSIVLSVRKYGGDIRYELDGDMLTACIILGA